MSLSHGIRRLVIHLRSFLNVLSRYVSFPLRLVHRLFHNLLRLYSRVASTQLQRIDNDAPSDRLEVAGSSQPILSQWNDQLPSPPGGWPTSNVFLPILPLATAPSSSTHVLQSSSVAPEFRPYTPSDVIKMRYNKCPIM